MRVPVAGQFELPVSVGLVDSTVFEALRVVRPETEFAGTRWYRSGRCDDPEVFEALEPLHEQLLKSVSRFGILPYAINYSVNTTTVQPHDTQTQTTDWHIDGPGYCDILMTSDTMPTEFLIASGVSQLKARRKYVWPNWNPYAREHIVRDVPEDGQLAQAGLSVATPEPFCLVAMHNHVHRSAANKTETDITRTWIRAGILRTGRLIRQA